MKLANWLPMVFLMASWFVGGACVTSVAGETESKVSADDARFFEKSVEPLLARRCFGCHSHGAKKLEGNLALDARSGWRRGGDSGPAVVPGKPDDSLLIKAVRRTTPDLAMPPDEKLPQEEIDVLVDWVRRGAPDPRKSAAGEAAGAWQEQLARRSQWWSWQPVRNPATPDVDDPAWSFDPLDRFVAREHQSHGLAPAADADRRTLARRLSFALTGLPPDVDEVDAFERDDSPDAYERLVERQLASPRFGEHWARHWLDLFRYSDTHGSEHDPLIPHIWRYRDYLIRALNGDLPYDRFVREHLAGDRLAPRRNLQDGFNESPIATGVFRFVEFYPTPLDVKNEEIMVLDSQIDLFAKSFLGLTLSCARCHDHKFDALSARDYQAIYGVFASTRTTMHRVDDSAAREAATVELTARQPALRAAIAARWREQSEHWPRAIAAAQAQHAAGGAVAKPEEAPAAQIGLELETRRWRRALADAKDKPLDLLHPLAKFATVPAGSTEPLADEIPPQSWSEAAKAWSDGAARRAAEFASKFRTWADFSRPDSPSHSQWFPSADFPGPAAPGALAIAPTGAAALTAIYPQGWFTHLASNKQGGTLRSPNFTLDMKFVSVLACGVNAGRVRLVIENFPSDSLLFAQAMPSVNEPRLHWVTLPIREVWAGRRAYLEISPRDEMTYPGKMPDASKMQTDGRSGVGIRAVVFHDQGGAPALEPALPAEFWQAAPRRSAVAEQFTASVRQALERWSAEKATDEDARLLDALLRAGLLANEHPAGCDVDRLLAEYRAHEARFPPPLRVIGTADEVGFDEAFFPRGNYRRADGSVPRRFLEVLGGRPLVVVESTVTSAASPASLVALEPRWNATRSSGREALAEELLAPTNPLVTRVIVNRLWQHLTGRAIVGSVDNFGALGELPSHPELLDHLATSLRRDDWSVKTMLRRVATSRTYRQSANASAAARETDPANRWLSHAHVRRLEAESIRDALLAASGRLDLRMGGLGVPLPLRAAYKDFENPVSGPLDGNGRRSIYLEARRNYPQPLLAAFDQPKPVLSVGERPATNVPAQSLALLNDPFLHQQAEALAKRLAAGDGASDSAAERVRRLYRGTLGREPSAADTTRALQFLETQRSLDGAGDAAAAESQAWSDLAHALFNLKEFLYVR